MKARILILPVSAAVIAALVAWRTNRETQHPASLRERVTIRQLAPRFELYDQNSQLVKFERYLGRTRLLLLFVGDVPAADHPLARLLLDRWEATVDAGVQIVIVGTATPFANRQAEEQAGESFPVPVLTDVGRQTPVPAPTHRQWGLAGGRLDDIREGLFLIDRDGTVTSDGTTPKPVADPRGAIERIARSEWPAQS